MEELKDLGFKQSRFDVSLTSIKVNPTSGELKFHNSGLDKVDFQFGPNPGEPMRPLKRIASSGEMARVMLAMAAFVGPYSPTPGAG
mgnify:CR=1 FL=1